MSEFKINVKSAFSALDSDSKFIDLLPDQGTVIRLAPPVGWGTDEESPVIWMTHIHYGLKKDDGSTGGLGLANLALHGNDETGRKDYIQDLATVLKGIKGSDTLNAIGKRIQGNKSFYGQGWSVKVLGKGKYEYLPGMGGKCGLVRFAKTAADQMKQIAESQAQLGEEPFFHPREGQPIVVHKTGTGLQTKYRVERSGVVEDLEKQRPNWREEMHDDVLKAVGLNIVTRERQKELAQHSFPDLPWEKLEEEYGL